MNESLYLKGKTVAITGASRGIGKKIASIIQELGGNLVLGGRSLSEKMSEQVLELPLDVSDEETVKFFYERAINHFGKVDVLINSAGIGFFASILESSTEEFDQMISVNLRGTYLTCKYFGKHMAERGEGHILNVVSIAGTTALPGCGGYSASKFGLRGLTKVLQAELRTQGVQVTSVIPGSVNSSFWDQIDSTFDMSKMIPVESLAKHLLYLFNQPPGAFVDEIIIMPPLGIL
jgi:3-oxoacyl-[acyl-carrier protein] reductase